MAFLKCEIGRPLTLAIDDVAYNVKGKFGVQTVFHAGDDSFAMSPESAARQLEQAGVMDPIGQTLEFSKVDIGKGRTAINIKLVSQGATSGPPKAQPFDRPVQSAPTSRHVAPQPSEAVQASVPFSLMQDAHRWTLEFIAPMYVNKGIPLSMDALAACAHSLFIQATRN